MKHPFDATIVKKAGYYCRKRYPNEACGFITEDNFVPMVNIARDKINHFQIDPKEFIRYNKQIKAIVHSHADYPHLSKDDMESQIRSNLPWGVVFVEKGGVRDTVFFGDQIPPYELLERPFVHGVFDCYGLVRDYYRTKGKILPIYPRDNLWWEKEPSMFLDNFIETGFKEIDIKQLKVGDVVLMKIFAPVVNHCGIYLGNDTILHHLYGRLSMRDSFSRWRRRISGYYRYVGGKNAS
jgi:proteasome lid subunit RPN8/RPN11